MNRLKDKIALVTGASRGIGDAIAEAFIDEGAIVVFSDSSGKSMSKVERLGPQSAWYQHLDVSSESDWQSVIANITARFGKIDILVNNAAVSGQETDHPQDPENVSLEDWQHIHRVNLDGVFLGCKYAIKAMRKSGTGAIINISSRSGIVGAPDSAAYASSKAAVRNHTKSVALYCAEQGLKIRCNSIHPALIFTSMWEAVLGTGDIKEALQRTVVRRCPAQRFGLPSEVAAIAVMLASDEATFMNGSEVVIDGGILAGSAVPFGKKHLKKAQSGQFD